MAIYSIADSIGGKRLGLLSIVLVAFSIPFAVSAHLARYDVITSALGFIAIAVYFRTHSSSFSSGFFCGLLIALAFETHPHGLIFLPTILALFLFDLQWQLFRSRKFYGFLIGGLLGLGIYISIHILPAPQLYFLRMGLSSATHGPPITTLNLKVIINSIKELAYLLLNAINLLLPVLFFSTIKLLQEKTLNSKRLLVLLLSFLISSTLLFRNKFLYYAILFSPAIHLVIAYYALLMFDLFRKRRGVLDFIYQIFILSSIILAMISTSMMFRENQYKNYLMVQSKINESVHISDSIIGSQTYWFGLYENTYYSWEQIVFYQTLDPTITVEDALKEFKPDIFIIDGHLSNFISNSDGDSVYSKHLRIPRDELFTFLDQNADLVSVFNGDSYGQISIYRIRW